MRPLAGLLFAAALGLGLPTSAIAAETKSGSTSLETAFAKADSDGDGSLSPGEAKAGGFFVGESFEETDDDASGTVTLFELGSAISRTTRAWLEEHGQRDANDDGSVDKKEATTGSRIRTVFDRADTNSDGRVDEPEMRNFASRSYYSETAAYPVVPNLFNKKF